MQNWEKQNSYIYKELNESWWNTVLTETPYAVIAGLVVGALRIWNLKEKLIKNATGKKI